MEKKKPASVKRFVAGCVSFALCMTMLFTANANMYSVKADVQKETLTGRTYTDTEKVSGSADDLFAGADLFSSEKKNDSYLGLTKISDLDEYLSSGEITDIECKVMLAAVAPPNIFFYSEMSDGYGASGIALGIFSFLSYYLSVISLAVLLAFLMISITDFKQKENDWDVVALHYISFFGIMFLLVAGIICVASSALIISELSLSFKVVICAAPIINIILALGMLIQYCILNAKRN